MNRSFAILCGLLLGVGIQHARFAQPNGLRSTACFARWDSARAWIYTLGLGMLLMAALCWLAVIDVDLLRFPPLTAGTLVGGALFGTAAGLSGFTPGTALAGLGGGRLLESLCAVIGCAAGLQLGGLIPAGMLDSLLPPVEGTLFRLTLTDPWLLSGGFASLACLGLLVCVTALLVRRPAVPYAAAVSDREDPEPIAPTDDAAAPDVPAPDDFPVSDRDAKADDDVPDDASDPFKHRDKPGPTLPNKCREADGDPLFLEVLAEELDEGSRPITGASADLLDGAPPNDGDVFIPPILYSGDADEDEDEDPDR